MAKAAGSGNAKQRAFFGRKDRLDKEAAATRERTADDTLKAEQAKKAASARAELGRKELARRAELRRETEQRAADRRKAAATRREFNRDIDAKRAEAARQDKARADAERKMAARNERTRRQADARRAEQTKREFNRDADAKKAAAVRTLRIERQATRDVRQEQHRARESMQFRQRQETNELRSRHRIERKDCTSALAQHDADYVRQIEKIDLREQRALAEFDNRRGSIRGRIEELRKGRDTIDEQRRAIQEGFQQQRIDTTRQLEAVKDREMEREFLRPIEQARERMDMMQRHATERTEQVQQQEQARPGAVAERAEVIERTQAQAQEQQHEARNERADGMTREFNLGPRL